MNRLHLTSQAFSNNGMIPSEYTCDGADGNPPLTIRDIPAKSRSFALIVDDPDAPKGTWVHWVVWNIGPDTTDIPANSVPGGALQGTNDFGKRSYGGPCPPSGTHRYFFKLYALDISLALKIGATKVQLEEAMKGHIEGRPRHGPGPLHLQEDHGGTPRFDPRIRGTGRRRDVQPLPPVYSGGRDIQGTVLGNHAVGRGKKRECRNKMPGVPELRTDLLVRGRHVIRDKGLLRRGREARRLSQVPILRYRQAFMPRTGAPPTSRQPTVRTGTGHPGPVLPRR